MSTLKTDALGSPNFATNLQVGDGFVRREYYEQATTPETNTNSAVWYDTTNDQIKILINGTWSIFSSSVYVPPFTGGDTAVFAGGYPNNVFSNVIQTVSIPTTGNATDFGDLTSARRSVGTCASKTRGVFAGSGLITSNVMDYIAFATTGNATDFGDLLNTNRNVTGLSNLSRGVFGGGQDGGNNGVNTLQYITISTTGNTTDFGDLTVARYGMGGMSGLSRGVFTGGQTGSSVGTRTNVQDYITIATTGNATDFGDMFSDGTFVASCSNGTRGITCGGYYHETIIEYITIDTLGSAADFGDPFTGKYGRGAANNDTRAVFAGGNTTNVIEYVTIDTLGNGTDFGDLLFTDAEYISGAAGT